MATQGWYPDGGGGQSYWDGTTWIGRRPNVQQSSERQAAALPGWYPDGGSMRYWDGRQWLAQAALGASPGYSVSRTASNRGLLLVAVGGAILVALIAILIVLMSGKPWESQAYKQCVAEQKQAARQGGIDPSHLESQIDTYCHRNYD